MENSRIQYSAKFIDQLKPNYVGLPSELVVYLANLVYKPLGDDPIESLSENSSETKWFRQRQLKEFVDCSLFMVSNLHYIQGFRAYLVEHDYVEISSCHKENLKSLTVDVRPIANQRDMDRRWSAVKSFIGQSCLNRLVKSIFNQLDKRNKVIVCKVYGIYGFKKASVHDVAAEHELSKARVYQILQSFERKQRMRVFRAGLATGSRPNENRLPANGNSRVTVAAETELIDWLNEFGNKLHDYRISFASAMDYLSLKYPDEYFVLKKLVPAFQDTESFFDLVSDMNNRLIPRRPFDSGGPIIGDPYLIERLEDIDLAALPLPYIAIATLKASNIHNAGELARLNHEQISQIPSLRPKSINAILEFFKLYGDV